MTAFGKVLVVDDDVPFLETYKDILTSEGYTVETAMDRASALQKLNTGSWDVVILDQKLQGSGGPDEGIDLISEVVATGAKAIVATGFPGSEMIERAFREGAYDYLEKNPRLPTLLRLKMRHALEAVRERRLATQDRSERDQALRELWKEVRTTSDANRKGALLEELLLLLFKSIPGFEKAEARRQNKDEEIDLTIPNESKDPFWAHERSSYFLGECKNWSKPVGPDELDRLRAKVKRRHGRCRLGFFIAVGGFTAGFNSHLLAMRESDELIVPLGPDDVARLVEATDRNALLKECHKRSVTNGNGH